jgi:pilus assembly protein CpaE
LCEAEDEAWAAQMLQQGALAYVLRPNWLRDLKHNVLAGIARQPATAPRITKPSAGRGTVIAVMGAKGGVGATTVAANVASVLASTAKVILVELRPAFGSLCHFFRPHRGARGLQNLLAMNPADIGVADVESCLWPNRSIPGLRVLFAPEKPGGAPALGPDHARTILGRLSEVGDVVVVDLPPSLSESDQAILERSDTLLLAVERDALSIDAAKGKLNILDEYGILPQEAGLVIVNRVPLAAPMALADIESQFGVPTFGVIPPAADLCASAYRMHTPVVNHDAQSLMAASLVNLAKRLSGRN